MSRKWISVEDGLPPLDLPVWTFHKGYLMLGCRVGTAAKWRWHRCYTAFDWCWRPDRDTWKTYYLEEVDHSFKPTHWQYLPNPPEVKP
jgi:hypothetical protein